MLGDSLAVRPALSSEIGQNRAWVGRSSSERSVKLLQAPPPFERGAAQYKNSLSNDRSADGGRADNFPLRIEPDLGKVLDDLFSAEAEQSGDVLDEDERWAALDDDALELAPQSASRSTETLPGGSAGRRHVLAGESSVDQIVLPCGGVKGADVLTQPPAREGPPPHRCSQARAGVLVDLDVIEHLEFWDREVHASAQAACAGE
jgi:hypothetical protein